MLNIYNGYSFAGYNAFTPDLIGAFKFHASAVHGLDDKDVRISKRINLSTKKLRGFDAGKIGPYDSGDYIGGNYATAINFEANLPNLLPESTKTDVGLFLDFGNVWGVDYSDTIDDGSFIRSSTGVSLDFLTPVGPLSFSWTQPITKKSSDKTETFRFNLGTTF